MEKEEKKSLLNSKVVFFGLGLMTGAVGMYYRSQIVNGCKKGVKAVFNRGGNDVAPVEMPQPQSNYRPEYKGNSNYVNNKFNK